METCDQLVRPVLMIAAITSKFPDAIERATENLVQQFGSIVIASDTIQFNMTSYYEKQMGTDLQKQLIAFKTLVDPGLLADIKNQTNLMEAEFAEQHFGHVRENGTADENITRPVNIDPGYVTEAKLVLASTKNRDHRIYIGHGIFAEITMYFQQGHWKTSRWTYVDYTTTEFVQFLTECRSELRRQYARM